MNSREVEERLRYMLKQCDAFSHCKYYARQDCCNGCCDAVRTAVNALEKCGKRGVSMCDGIIIVQNRDGVFSAYDDTYDIVIHCESKEEQKKTIDCLKTINWIPVDEKLPETDNHILVSFSNCTEPNIGRYEADEDGGGAFFPGDEDRSYVHFGLFVNAWMPLPDSYKEDKQRGGTI